MKVTFLGTGDAFHGGGRGHSALLVEDALGRLLIDCGPSVPHALARAGLGQRDLDAVLLTHLHGDHYAGVPFLLVDAMHGARRERPLVIAGPPPTASRVEAMFALCYGNTATKRRPFFMDYREIDPGEAIDVCGRRVTGFRARHMSGGETALGLRIESGGKVLAVSGDTAATEELVALSRGADLFVCECALETPDENVLHLSVEEIVRERARWEARRMILTHLSAEARDAASTRGLEVADDGLVVSL